MLQPWPVGGLQHFSPPPLPPLLGGGPSDPVHQAPESRTATTV
jgi:hypothetical protein